MEALTIMLNGIVIHIYGGDIEMIRNPHDDPYFYLYLDKYKNLSNPGSDHINVYCPKCEISSSQALWNKATCEFFHEGDITKDFTRIQHATDGSSFTCAYCFNVSTTQELNPKCPFCTCDVKNTGSTVIMKNDSKESLSDNTVTRYECLNLDCSREFYL